MEAAPVAASTRRAALQAVKAARHGFEIRTSPPSQFYRVRACQKGFFPIVSEIGAVPILCATDLDAAIIAGKMWRMSAVQLLKDLCQLKAELDDSWDWRAVIARDLPNVRPRKMPPTSFKCVYYHPTQKKWFARTYVGPALNLYYPIGGYSTDAETASRFAAIMGTSISCYHKSGKSQPLALREHTKPPMKHNADAKESAGLASPRQLTRELSLAAPRQRSRKRNNKAADKANASNSTIAVPSEAHGSPAKKRRNVECQPATSEDVSRFRAYYMIYKDYEPYDLQAAMQLRKDHQTLLRDNHTNQLTNA
jgi:hypothetical protein